MTGLRISPTLTLPIDAVTQTFGCIGRRGAGKTYLAVMLAEQMLDAGAQIVALDPVGNWWGLRLDADGKRKGKDIFIIGGSRGDVPIAPEKGARIARLLVEKPVSAILDISRFRIGERKRFATDFAEEFFHLKKDQNSAVHLFLEEAQLFAPQHANKGEERMLGAFESIIRLGRNYGIGATMITQRPQSVNKEVLSQVECLCVLQVNGRHEREAIQKWVEEHGANRALVGELPGLGQGEGYVWSPSWLRLYERMHFAKKTTFDSSATPKVGAKQKATTLSKIDVEALKADMQDVIARAEQEDPKALQKRIAELERELKKKQTPAETPAKVEQIDRAMLLKLLKQELERVLVEEIRPKFAEKYETYAKDFQRLWQQSFSTQAWTLPLIDIATKAVTVGGIIKTEIQLSANPNSHLAVNPLDRAQPLRKQKNDLTGPEQRIIDAIAWFEAIGVEDPENPAVAFLAGYSSKSSSYTVPRSMLARKAAVSYTGDGRIQLTDIGRGLSNAPSLPGTNAGLQQTVLAKLPGPEKRLLAPLLEAWPNPMNSDELAKAAGYAVNSSSFTVPRSRLKSFGLIDYPGSGLVRARDILFPVNP